MFSDVLFFTYIFAGFVGLIVILLVLILKKYKSDGNHKLLVSMRNFMVCTAMIDALYFYIDYHVLVSGHHETSPLLRVLDICLFVGQVYFWCGYMREKSGTGISRSGARTSRFIYYGLFALSLITSVICYGFLMNDYYRTSEGFSRNAAVAVEIFLGIFLTAVNLWTLHGALQQLVQKLTRRFITMISVFIAVNGTWNAILVTELMTSHAGPEADGLLDPTAFFIFITNILTVVLVLREDFSALFTMPEQQIEEPQSTEMRLDYIAQAHNLTRREREVMELAYEGLTNPEIAEELTISRYTVKHHMHNIFEKLDISTRMELVHLVNQSK